ncbi:MAG: terminase family protein [Bacteroidetes bacterium]|nr:terminase family protein [Bacteroidota bacterium]
MTDQRQYIKPQPGFQTAFLSSPADIVIGGGAAGAGKSYALLLEPIRHSANSKFRAVIFRRTIPQIKNEGGLWDTSKEVYEKLRDLSGRSAKSTEQPPKWRFPSGATLLFSHLEHENDVKAWDGAQVALLGFDELIHFTSSQFWYMVSRNRSASGVRPYVRATTNPQTSGWVKRLISWWIYPDDHEVEDMRGMPIPERAGVLRWFFRHNEVMYWGNSIEDVMAALPEEVKSICRSALVKSITFIPGTLDDNQILNEKDPGYEGNLFAQDKKHGRRLRRGCWYDAEGENELFRYEDLYDMFRNKFVPSGEAYQTADIAMEGADMFRVGSWSGLRLEKIESWEKSDGKMIWENMERSAQEFKVYGKHIAFDTNGVGNFLKGFFRTAFDFRSQSVPLEVDGLKLNYANLRTQCAFKLSEMVAQHKLYIACENERVQQLIIEEFEAHKKTGQNAAGKLTITPKEEVKAQIRRSPDYFDMILMRMVFEIQPRKRSALLSPLPKP